MMRSMKKLKLHSPHINKTMQVLHGLFFLVIADFICGSAGFLCFLATLSPTSLDSYRIQAAFSYVESSHNQSITHLWDVEKIFSTVTSHSTTSSCLDAE